MVGDGCQSEAVLVLSIARKHKPDAGFLYKVFDGQFYEDGLIKNYGRLQRRRNVNQMLDGRLYPIDDGDGVAVVTLLEDRHIDRALPVNSHNVICSFLSIIGVTF